MNVQIEPSWKEQLTTEFEQPYFQALVAFIKQEYASQRIFPAGSHIFNAFSHCPFADVRVVILGQDPYHGIGQANGLSFSVNDGMPLPPSLKNIFNEIRDDLGKSIPESGNLERWATQGVLLLNATLTVRAGQAGSHQNKGWERFTDAVIKRISFQKQNIVFLLWGNYAQKKSEIIDPQKHLVLRAKHPSPMAANQGGWFGNKHFSQTNNYLSSKNLPEIMW